MSALKLAVGLLLSLVAAIALGQDRAPYRWKIRGETVETLQSTFTLNFHPDQSTAKGVVEAYLALTDNRASAAAVDEAARAVLEAALRRSSAPIEEALLDVEARGALRDRREAEEAEKAEKRAQLQLTAKPSRIVSVTDGADDGEVLVETAQTIGVRELYTPPNDYDVYDIEHRMRFHCSADAHGVWHIEDLEQWDVDPARPPADNAVPNWERAPLPIEEYFKALKLEAPRPSAPDTSSPELAARSLFDALIAHGAYATQQVALASMTDRVDALGPLIDPALNLASMVTPPRLALPKRKIESVEATADGTKVTFAPALAGRTEVWLRETRGSWRVFKIGYYRTISIFGDNVETFEQVSSPYELR